MILGDTPYKNSYLSTPSTFLSSPHPFLPPHICLVCTFFLVSILNSAEITTIIRCTRQNYFEALFLWESRIWEAVCTLCTLSAVACVMLYKATADQSLKRKIFLHLLSPHLLHFHKWPFKVTLQDKETQNHLYKVLLLFFFTSWLFFFFFAKTKRWPTEKIWSPFSTFSWRLMLLEAPRSIKIAGVPLADFIPQVIYSLNPSGPDKTEVNER